jgi:hypothetical protein
LEATASSGSGWASIQCPAAELNFSLRYFHLQINICFRLMNADRT